MALDFAPGIYHGVLVEVVEDEGTGLVGDYAAGATVLTVGSGGALDLAGTCRIAGTDYTFTRDGETVTISRVSGGGGLAAAAEDGDPVVSLGVDGRPETRKQVIVDLDMTGDEDEEFPQAWVPGEWAAYYPLGKSLAGSIVILEDVPDGYRASGRPHAAPLFDGLLIDPDTRTKFEADDKHVVTADDVTAGLAVIDLTYNPIDESIVAFWSTLPQPPSEYHVDYPTRQVTFPLEGVVLEGDELWVHYAHRDPALPPWQCDSGAIPEAAVEITAPFAASLSDFNGTGLSSWRCEATFAVTLPAGASAAEFACYAIVLPPEGGSDAGDTWLAINDIDPALAPDAGYTYGTISALPGRTVPLTIAVQLSDEWVSGTVDPGDVPMGHIVGIGYAVKGGVWNQLPEVVSSGRIGLTDKSVCSVYWGMKISTLPDPDTRDEPAGPIGGNQ